MNTHNKIAGAAALIQAFCYIFGFVMLATVMNPGEVDDWTRLQKLEFVLEREALFQLWSIVIYVLFGVALVALTSVLHGLLKQQSSLLMSLATPFGYIWAGLVIASGMVASVGLSSVAELYTSDPVEAARLWSTIATVQDGLGGGVEVVGGIWVLLLSVASLSTRQVLPRLLNWIGLIVGVTGIATVVPPLAGLGAIFGLTQIFWFAGVGIVLLRQPAENE